MSLATDKSIHRVKRLLFEVNVEQESQARYVHTELSRICHNRIESLLEKCINSAGDDNLYRIDHIELDLGQLDLENLERGVLREVENELKRILPQQLQHSTTDQYGRGAYIQSRFELLETYASQGRLPWWAKQTQTDPISETITELLDKAPESLRQRIPALLQDEKALLRVESHCSAELLVKLCKLLYPSLPVNLLQYSDALGKLLHASTARKNVQKSNITLSANPRRYIWQSILHILADDRITRSSRPLFWHEVLLRIAVITHSRHEHLLTGLYHSLEQGLVDAVPDELNELILSQSLSYQPDGSKDILASHMAEVSSESKSPGSANEQTGSDEDNMALHPEAENDALPKDRLVSKDNGKETVKTTTEADNRTTYVTKQDEQEPQTIASKSSNSTNSRSDPEDHAADVTPDDSMGAISGGWKSLLHILQTMTKLSGAEQQHLERHMHEQVAVLISDGESPARDVIEKLSRYKSFLNSSLGQQQLRAFELLLKSDSGTTLSRQSASREERIISRESRIEKAKEYSAFSSFDEAYIENAGLVILGPFLERFFTRLELLKDKRFKDTAAAQRAVGLLQYLANEDPTGPEFLLPLNKVLCGLEPEAVFDAGPDLTEQEKIECEQLLHAVIEHASILRKMSVTGFRGSFLLRNGLLESRDGAWLLRVERETFDVVLDRFPWSFSWIKLPWMSAALRVEW